MKKYKASELVEDFDVYPRGHVDSQHVGYMLASLVAGAKLPPIVIDKKTKRIVDGVHRVRAIRRHLGDDAQIDCIEKTFASEAELLLEAIRLNANHGRTLSQFDRARCITLADKLAIDTESLASAMTMTVDAVAELRVDRLATERDSKLTVPIKRTIRHMAGKSLSKRQMEANGRLSGMNQQFYVNQVIELIEAGLLDTSDKNLMTAIEKLRGLLESQLVAA